MNLNQILNMVVKTFTRRLVNWGVNKGMDLAARRGTGGAAPGAKATPVQQRQANAAREAAKRARQAAKITRRLR